MQWNLIRLRKEADMTQKDLADLLGISVTTYVSKENCHTQFKADEMFILQHVFKKDLEEIFLPTNCNIIAICE